MIEVILNDRLGKKIAVKCEPDDTVGDLKKLVAAQIGNSMFASSVTNVAKMHFSVVGTRPDKIRIQKWYTVFKDHVKLEDYEIHDGAGLELYYN